MSGSLSVADSQMVYYKQRRGGQMEVWLDSRYTDDSRQTVLQKRQLKQHHVRVRAYFVNYTETVTFISVFCSQAAVAKQR